jgi:hypothetical protein
MWPQSRRKAKVFYFSVKAEQMLWRVRRCGRQAPLFSACGAVDAAQIGAAAVFLVTRGFVA